MGPRLTGIRRYPVKSCRGEDMAAAEVAPWGLAGDRRWMLVDSGGAVVTAREVPRLVLVSPEFVDGGLVLRAPGTEPLRVHEPEPGAGLLTARVHASEVAVTAAAAPAHAWFSALLGRPVRLVHLDDPTRRRPNPAYSRAGDRVSLADGYPLLLAAEDSLAALNELIGAGRHAVEGPLPMIRFRPNLVVAGAAAWDEDAWRRVRIGAVEFRVAKACDRCVLTTVHPDTAVKGREPLVTLARHRRWGGKVWFAVNLIPDRVGVGADAGAREAGVRVGDRVELLERAADRTPLGAAS